MPSYNSGKDEEGSGSDGADAGTIDFTFTLYAATRDLFLPWKPLHSQTRSAMPGVRLLSGRWYRELRSTMYPSASASPCCVASHNVRHSATVTILLSLQTPWSSGEVQRAFGAGGGRTMRLTPLRSTTLRSTTLRSTTL